MTHNRNTGMEQDNENGTVGYFPLSSASAENGERNKIDLDFENQIPSATNGPSEISWLDGQTVDPNSTQSEYANHQVDTTTAGELATTTTEPNAERISKSYRLPSIHAEHGVRSYFVGDMAIVVRGVEGLVRESALIIGARVSSIDATTRRWHDSRGTQIKFTIRTDMNSSQALAFWDALEMRISEWSSRLPPLANRLLEEGTAISVEWIEQDASESD